MFKLFSIVEEKDSKINGKLQVVKDFQGTRIIAGGVSQSGWLVKSIWKKGLKRVSTAKQQAPLNFQLPVSNVLILGLGGGSATEIVSEYWPEAKIIGVDIDPEMVSLGKKYLQLSNIPNLEIEIADAALWLKSNNEKFDLVLVDLFKGNIIPAKFYTDKFIKAVSKVLTPEGAALFNHLYSFAEREDSEKLQKKLRKNFATLISVVPEANIIFLCFAK